MATLARAHIFSISGTLCSLLILTVTRIEYYSSSIQVICSLAPTTTQPVNRFTNSYIRSANGDQMDISQTQDFLVTIRSDISNNGKTNIYPANLSRKEAIEKSSSKTNQRLLDSDKLMKNLSSVDDEYDNSNQIELRKLEPDISSTINKYDFDKPPDIKDKIEDESVQSQYGIALHQDIKRIDNNNKFKASPSGQLKEVTSVDGTMKKDEFNVILKKQKLVHVNNKNEKKIDNSSHIFIKNKSPAYMITNMEKSFGDLTSESSLIDAPEIFTPSPLHYIEPAHQAEYLATPAMAKATSKPVYSANGYYHDHVTNSANKTTITINSPVSTNQPMIALESGTSEHDSNCALVLKRTYVIKPDKERDNDEWGENFVFNDANEKKKKASLKSISTVCVRHVDVNRAIAEAQHRIKFENPNNLGSLEVPSNTINVLGELSLATSQLLIKKFDLSHDEVLNALPMIDMSSTTLYWHHLCPKFVRPMHCPKSRYRTITAHCNNLKHSAWGASKTPYSRYMPPDYADGLQEPRKSKTGEPLPSARLITSIVHRDVDVPTHDLSILFMSWGQILDHDMTRAAQGEAPDCCPQYLKGLCFPIPVPEEDPFYRKFNVKCLKFDRSPAAIKPKCLLGPRAQINEVTSPIDASFVYGSTKSLADKLRKFVDGKMKVWNYFHELKLKPLLPPKEEKPDEECVARPKGLYCFLAGDVRVNEQTHLTVLHTLYVREHNRMAKILGSLNLDWDDEKIYQEVRHITAAGVQHVLVTEFLPLLLGHKHLKEYGVQSTNEGYDPTVTTSTGTAFAAAAFRYGHSMIQGLVRRYDKFHKYIKGELLRYLFKRPFLIYEPGVLDELIGGLINTPSQYTDPFVTEEVSGHLFQPPKAQFGHDLPAINIQRGRDQGVPGYNDWREWCGLPRAKSFSDLELHLTNRTAHHYSRIYKHVDDIDLWSAGVSERKMPGTQVGPTFACIISRQFANTKRGDRFWYENLKQPSSFTPEQLKEIKKITLAKILCTNADDLPTIQPWALRLPHPIYNARVPCESLPSINLKLWDAKAG